MQYNSFNQYLGQNQMQFQQHNTQIQQYQAPQYRTCRQHKNNKYISVCSFPLCHEQRLCCLKCMVSKHTDHVNFLILLDELSDSNVEELSFPTNWTNILGNLKEDLGEIIRICKKNTQTISSIDNNIQEEIKKIDDLFDMFTKEIMSRIETVRETIKRLCKVRSQATSQKLSELVTTLRKILSPNDLLKLINDFISSKDNFADNDLANGSQKQAISVQANGSNNLNNSALAKMKGREEVDFEEKLQLFFTKTRITDEDHEEIIRKFNFLTKNRKNEDIMTRTPLNLVALNDIREGFLNSLESQVKFAEIFFPDIKLYDYESLEKMHVYTSTYDEVTKIPGVINDVQPIDSETFMLVRDNQEVFEVWDIKNHSLKNSICLPGSKSSVVLPIKTQTHLFLTYVGPQNSIVLADFETKKIVKTYPSSGQHQVVKQLKVLSPAVYDEMWNSDNNNTKETLSIWNNNSNEKNENCNINNSVILAVLYDTGDIKILNLSRGSTAVELKNKGTLFMEVMPEMRYYTCPEKGVISSNLLMSATQDVLNVWYPLIGRCVRNLKLGGKPNEVLKQIAAFEISNFEKQVSYFSDYVVGCPSKCAVVTLTNKALRIYNWFKAQCLRELAIDECDRFELLPIFIKNDLKNIFLLYNISEQKPAEYVTCDWSSNNIEYWNSGSLTNYTMVRALNKFKVLEIGKYKGPADNKSGNSLTTAPSTNTSTTQSGDSNSKPPVICEVRARIKSLT